MSCGVVVREDAVPFTTHDPEAYWILFKTSQFSKLMDETLLNSSCVFCSKTDTLADSRLGGQSTEIIEDTEGLLSGAQLVSRF